MSVSGRIRLACRLFLRELRGGELLVPLLALLVAVTALSGVAMLSSRVEQGLTRGATALLGADLVIQSDQPLPPRFATVVREAGVREAGSVTFPSMVFAADKAVLSTIKAVSATYPLRGEVRVRLADGRLLAGQQAPQPGEAWADARLLSRLGVAPGAQVQAGRQTVRIAGVIEREPDGAMDLYNFIPRLMISQQDLAATGLIQEGSRARWRLMLAGSPAEVEAVRERMVPMLGRGMRLENVEQARPEVRTALERARRFLGLTAMLTVALAAAAVTLSVRRYLVRHWQSVAILRCLGLSAREVGSLFAILFLLLGVQAGLLGGGAGWLLQEGLLRLGASWLGTALPPVSPFFVLIGPLAAVLLLAGLALPPLLAAREVPPVAVLRDEVPVLRAGMLAPVLAAFAMLGLAAWQMGDSRQSAVLLAGLGGFLMLAGLVAALVILLFRRLPTGGRVGWRYGLANLARRPWLAMIQIVSLSVGLMALLTLTVVREDLLGAWQHAVPADAPNRFVINLQPAQRDDFRQVFAQAGLPVPELSPMVRARLLTRNDKALSAASFRDEEARRMVEREFNLSWRAGLPPGNVITAGQWWTSAAAPLQFSLEQGLAGRLGIRVGDRLRFDIAGTTLQGPVTSLRAVPWDSFRVNFFVLVPPGALERMPASWVTSFHAGPAQAGLTDRLVARFPNVSVIDVDAILDQVRDVIGHLARAIGAMALLTVAAGILVLWTALVSTRDERMGDIALMRALGASRRQLRAVILSELIWLGAFSGLLAGGGAMAIGALAAHLLFNLPWWLDWPLLPLGVVAGTLVVLLAGWPLLDRVVRAAPAEVLRRL